MSPIEGLSYGLSIAFGPANLLAALVGVIVGTLIGVLPGIGPAATVALLLPATMRMSPVTAMIMVCAIYYGAMYGGSTTSILVNVPGETASIVTCIDGYQMAKKGRAGAALTVAAVGSFVAGTLGILGLMFFAPLLATFALSFGPPEFFSISLAGLFTLSRISGRPLWQTLLVLSLGMALATIGMDPISGTVRFTFGSFTLNQGVDVIPVVMGLFGIGEMLYVAEQAGGLPQIRRVRVRELFPNWLEWRRSWAPIFRGGVIGFFFGIIPGPAPLLSSFASYRIEKRLSKYSHEFGKGAIEGVAGPESANNAAVTGCLVPVLSLGLPFSAGTAILLAAIMIHGVQPGPLLITEHPDIFWGVVTSMYIGNIACLILNLPLIGVWVNFLRLPQSVILAIVVLLCLIGAFSINNSLFDLVVVIVMGVIGYLFRKLKLDPAPFVVALVLGPILEKTFKQSLYISGGDLLIFVQRPISAFFIVAFFLIVVVSPVWQLVASKRRGHEFFEDHR
jgi:putative tricarboxylic transport membrane protein